MALDLKSGFVGIRREEKGYAIKMQLISHELYIFSMCVCVGMYVRGREGEPRGRGGTIEFRGLRNEKAKHFIAESLELEGAVLGRRRRPRDSGVNKEHVSRAEGARLPWYLVM